MARRILSLVLSVLAATSHASEKLVVAAPIGLISDSLIQAIESRASLDITLHPYMYETTPMTTLALDPGAYDLILIDRVYIPIMSDASLIAKIADYPEEGQSKDKVYDQCPMYATGQTVAVTDARLDGRTVTWQQLFTGKFGVAKAMDFSSVVEAGEAIIEVFGNEQCATSTCTISTVTANLRIILAATSQLRVHPDSTFSLAPDYRARQMALNQPDLQTFNIKNHDRRWAKHWCSTSKKNSEAANRFLTEIYNTDMLNLNAHETTATLTNQQYLVTEPAKNRLIDHPGSDLFDLYAIVVGVGESLYVK